MADWDYSNEEAADTFCRMLSGLGVAVEINDLESGTSVWQKNWAEGATRPGAADCHFEWRSGKFSVGS